MFLRATRLLCVAKKTPPPLAAAARVGAEKAEGAAAQQSRRGGGKNKSSPAALAASTAPPHAAKTFSAASSFVPDHREKVLHIFQRLAEINSALQERYKAQSYQVAVDKLKRDDFIFLHFPPNIMPPGVDDAKRQQLLNAVNTTTAVGDKLKAKIVEILSTGDLAELHKLQAKPMIRAIQELTQVHGVGPRTAVTFYKKYGIKTVEELQQRVQEQETSPTHSGGHDADDGSCSGMKKAHKKTSLGDSGSVLHLTEAQRLGLKYHRDIMQRIPYEEVRLHEAFLKLRLRKYLGKGYELSICGSYRRRLPTSGDIDVLITRKIHGKGNAAAAARRKRKSAGHSGGHHGADDDDDGGRSEQGLAPQEVLAAFVEALQRERYIEAILAQGSTKFMGVSRLKSYNYNAGATSPKLYPARRLDIRFVEPECFPAALLYFTGSKNFNVVMRAEAIKQNYVLNEYGLFRDDPPTTSAAEGDACHRDSKNNNNSSDCGGNNSNSSNGNNGGGRHGGRGRWNAEAFQKLVRAQYYSAKSPAFMDGDDGEEKDVGGDDFGDSAGDATRGRRGAAKESTSRQRQRQQQELAALWREVEARRVKVKHERDVFAELGMAYVPPEHREM